MKRLEMKLQYNINREAAKILALSSGKIDKYEYLRGEKILPPDQSRVIEQARFIYSPLGKALKTQTETAKDQRKKQIEALKVLKPVEQKLAIKDVIPKDQLNEVGKNELERENLIYKTNKYIYIYIYISKI